MNKQHLYCYQQLVTNCTSNVATCSYICDVYSHLRLHMYITVAKKPVEFSANQSTQLFNKKIICNKVKTHLIPVKHSKALIIAGQLHKYFDKTVSKSRKLKNASIQFCNKFDIVFIRLKIVVCKTQSLYNSLKQR